MGTPCVDKRGFQALLCPCLAVGPWVSPLASLGLSFLICTMGTVTVLHSAIVEDHTNICLSFGEFESPYTGEHVTLKSVPAQSPHSVLPNLRTALGVCPVACEGGYTGNVIC